MATRVRLTKTLHNRIVAYLRGGCYFETAAKAAGISRSTLRRWIARATDPDETNTAYKELLEAVEEAVALAEISSLETITKASKEHWQAAAWRLERRFPKRWSRQERLEHTGADGGPIQTQAVDTELVMRTVQQRIEAAKQIGSGETVDNDDDIFS